MTYPKFSLSAVAVLALSLLLAVAATAGAGAQSKEKEKSKSEQTRVSPSQTPKTGGDILTVPLSDPSRPAYVKATLMQGSITVKAYQGKEVIVTADNRPDDDDDEEDEDWHDSDDESDRNRRKGMKKITNYSSSITIEEDNNEVKIGTGYRGMSNTLDMVIQVPVNSSLKLNTMNDGDIYVNGVKGDVEVSNLNGNIRVSDVDGSVVADAMNGDIDVIFTGVDAKKTMSFSSMNGDIDVSLPASAKATFKLRTDQGEIYSDFDMKLDVKQEDIKGDRASKNGRRKLTIEKVMTGELNGGGAEMTFNNFNGDIYIRKAR